MRSNEMTLMRDAGLIDMADWFEDRTFGQHMTNAVRAAFADNPPRLCFPLIWDFGAEPSDGRNGPVPDDPVMLYVDLPLGSNPGDNSISFGCSLEGAVDDLIESLSAYQKPGKIIDEDGKSICRRIASRLRELADKLDGACADEPEGLA